ncbi:alpha-2A adrenergic receptor-like isoform X2 [Patiria miniata]|uniref:G-protein coupled receptors family 1 profile domain-containing protein n=1 Tax=Patiria miniata TaxID=46514 RepID=A0A914AV50_PATMI|nr:alpha-2A adrenergic receptor-like isoform X2 [Patiria miniata]
MNEFNMNYSTNASLVETSRPLSLQICLSVSLFALMLLAIGGNLIVFLAIFRSTSLRAQVANIFIVNLALTDFGCSVLVMPFSLVSVWQGRWVFSPVWCKEVCLLNYCFIITSMLTLALISVDRRIYVTHPLLYSLIMTRRRAVALVLSTWVVALAFAVPPLVLDWVEYDDNEIVCAIDWEIGLGASVISYTVSACAICYLAPIVVIVYSYWGVLKVARRHAARIVPVIHLTEVPHTTTTTRRESQYTSSSRSDTQQPNEARTDPRQVRGKKYATRAIKLILTLVIFYIICNTPFCLTKLIKVAMGDNEAVPSYISTLASWMAFLNPACNPVIYSILREDFRTAFLKILPKCCRRCGRKNSGNSVGSDCI